MPLAVLSKFLDDSGTYLAGLITYTTYTGRSACHRARTVFRALTEAVTVADEGTASATSVGGSGGTRCNAALDAVDASWFTALSSRCHTFAGLIVLSTDQKSHHCGACRCDGGFHVP